MQVVNVMELKEDSSYPPWNFSWIVANKLAAMGCPHNIEQLNYLVKHGVNHLITLSPEKKPPVSLCQSLKWTVIPVQDLEAPSIKQIEQFIEICQNAILVNEVIGIHCRTGRGRTGVMAACYLVFFHDLVPERAILNVRLQRPGSIETYEQEKIVAAFRDVLRGTK